MRQTAPHHSPRCASYLKEELTKPTLHTRFAHIWNEIVDAMRTEDILSDKERLQLRYFLINLRLPTADGRSYNYAPEVQASIPLYPRRTPFLYVLLALSPCGPLLLLL